jgi:hypothetical protein
MKRILTGISGFLLLSFSMQAQNFFNAYKEDANTYLKYYSAPVFETNLYNFSDGWSHQAKTLKPGKFTLEITANYTLIPESRQNFVFVPSEYEHIDVLDSGGNPVTSPVKLPTAFGGKSNYKIRIKAPSNMPSTYDQIIRDVPQGLKEEFEKEINFIGIGMPGSIIQIRAGLPLSSEIAIRYFPSITYAGVHANLFGIGIKHDVGKYLLKNKKIHLAGLISFASGNISVQSPDDPNLTASFQIQSYNLQVFASYDWKFFSIYGSTGITQGYSRLKLKGDLTYDYDIVDNNGNLITTHSETLHDPLDLKHSLFTPKSSIGILLNLKFLHIFAQYNLQKYSGFHAGIAFNI